MDKRPIIIERYKGVRPRLKGVLDEGQIVPLTCDGEILDSHLAGHL